MGKSSKVISEKDEAIRELRKMLKPGDVVYCVLRHVAASGMSRRIDFFTIKKNRPHFLSYYVGKALGLNRPRDKDGLTVSGCGMDMGFHVVYELGHALFPKGFIPAKIGRHGRNGSDPKKVDTDGGYALESRWL